MKNGKKKKIKIRKIYLEKMFEDGVNIPDAYITQKIDSRIGIEIEFDEPTSFKEASKTIKKFNSILFKEVKELTAESIEEQAENLKSNNIKFVLASDNVSDDQSEWEDEDDE